MTPVQNTVAELKARSQFLTAFPGLAHMSPKHNHYLDFGYPTVLSFAACYQMYRRHGLARGAIHLTAEKTWETLPVLTDTPEDEKESKIEEALSKRLRRIRFWQNVIDTDRMSMVGAYAGLIMRIGDDKRFQEPVDSVTGGPEALREVIPAWEGQLTVAEWESDQEDENYGQPKMYQFNEASVAGNQNKTRSFMVHPDRVLLLSDSGTVHDHSALEPGYNALLDAEKISGAGGEGFWKNAKAAPVLEVDKDAKIKEMAAAMDVPTSEVFDKIGAQVDDYNTGLDKALMLQGIEVKSHNVSLISPEYFFNNSVQIFASSISIPHKILVGMQTGERASQEDQDQWAKTNMHRREMRILPFLEDFLDRLVDFGMLPATEWTVEWRSLLEDGPEEQMARADKMADINQKQSSSQQPFTHDEIRAAAGYEPLTPAQLKEFEKDEDEDWNDEPPKKDPKKEDEDDA